MKYKRYFFIIIIFSMLIFAPAKVIALTSGAAKFDTLYISIPEHDAVYGSPAIYYYTLDGAKAYCLEMAVKVIKTNYEGYPYSDPRIAYALIADHGYTWNDAADFQIRQAVIWALLGQINIENLQPGDPGCVQAAKNLYYAAASYSGNVEAPNISTNTIDFNIEGMQYVSNPITVTKAANNEYYDISLNGFPNGTYITDMNGNWMQTGGISWDSTFQVRIPLEVITYDINSIDMYANAVGTVYNTTTAYNSTGPRSQALLSTNVSSSTNSSPNRFYLARSIIAVGNLEVKKTDEYGEPIPQTTFQVSNGTTIQTQVTDSNGIARFTDLPAGTYTVTETSAANGYFNDRVDISVNVITGITISANKANKESKGHIKITKTDSETLNVPQGDATLAGAIYKIYAKGDIYAQNKKTLLYNDGQEVATLTTGENGVTNTIDLPIGKYYYREETPSNGYNLNDEEVSFSVDFKNQNIEFEDKTFTTQEDVKKNDIEIIKKLQRTDSTPQTNLAGAKFTATLKSDRTKVYYSNVTDENGYCIIRDLPFGTYEVEEIQVPDKALKIDNFDVTIDQDSSERAPYRYTKENVAKKMQITIYKEDKETGRMTQGDAKLENSEYTIYRDETCTDAVETVTIRKQDDGSYKATTGNYLIGTYYIKETKRPEGYLIDDTVHKVEQLGVNQNEEFSYHDITSTEMVEKGNIYIVKYQQNNTNFEEGSTTKNPATGVELTLSLNSNPDTKYTSIVNDIGYAEFTDIPYGWYTITETKSLPYIDIMDPQDVYIAKDKQQLHYIVEDPRRGRELKIVKKDSETGNIIPLSGATFKVWDVSAKRYIKQTYNYPTQVEIDEFVTSNDGTLILPNELIPGEYELEEVTAPYGYTLNTTRISFTIDATTPENPEIQKTITVDFPDTAQKARVVVFKKGEVLSSTIKEGEITRPTYEEKGLEGVEYTVTAAEDIITPDGTIRMHAGDKVTFKTDSSGIGKSEDLYLGKYTIRESATKSGFLIQSEEVPFVLEYRGQEVNIYDKNLDYIDVRQKFDLKLKKSLQKPIYDNLLKDAYKDVELGVYTREPLTDYSGKEIIGKDVLVDIIKVNVDGNSTGNYDLPQGKYYIKEKSTNENYKLNDIKYNFDFISTDDITPVIDVNINDIIVDDLDQLGKFRLYKYARENKNIIERVADFFSGSNTDRTHALAGAKFKIYYDDNGEAKELVTKDGTIEYTTDINGEINIENLPFGKYYYKEISAPKGYEIDDTLYSFEITKNHINEPLRVEVSNKLIDIKLFTKTDAFNSQIIPDCEFEILNENKEAIYKDKTDENGEFYMPIDLLEVGKIYYYKETSAPDIYDLNDELHEFTLNDDQTVSITKVENLRKTTTVKLTKTDFLGGQKIPNCKFELKSLETDYSIEGTTDENGEYYFENVPYGEYTYTEISAPKEYRIDTTPHRVKIDGNTSEINVSNEMIVNTSDINVMLFSIVLIISAIGICFIVYKNKDKIREYMTNKK
ncbi:MAG: SpaA isopeptide-forming pilin-related protein [Clostridia bacterium]